MKSSRRRVCILGVCVAIVAPLACGDDDGAAPCAGKSGIAGTRTISIDSGGRQRSFTITAPASALQGAPVPLVVVFHGVFGTGEAIQALTGWRAVAADEGFITVAGDGVERSWNAGVCCNPAMMLEVDDVGFSLDMIAAIEAEYCIDEQRIFATGFSNGAAMTMRLYCEAADRFAALAPVAGSLALFPCTPSRSRPLEIINNLDDPVVSFALGELTFDQALMLNECLDARSFEQPASNAECEVATDCVDGVRTALCAVDDLSHQWPGGASDPEGPFDATEHVWSFFAAQ